MNSKYFPIEALHQQLKQAKAMDRDLKRFGAKRHQYTWNAPVSVEELERFEQKIGISLPKEYRDFLLLAGDGGAGPFYGLFSLKDVEYWLQWEVEPEQTPIIYPEMDEDTLWYIQENWKRGCIPIGEQGDTYFTGLMVTGEHRGRVVYIEYEGSWVFFPKELNFLCWYERWLREVCNRYNDHVWFATNLDGDEEELKQYYQNAKTDEERQYALESMKKFPTFSKSTIAFLENIMLEKSTVEDARSLLQLIYRISPQFFYRFLEMRWQTERYDTVLNELWYAQWHMHQESEKIVSIWDEAVLEKLPLVSEDTWQHAIEFLKHSKKVSLKQVSWVLQKTKKIKNKTEMLRDFSCFADASENLDIWLEELEKRDHWEVLKTAIITVPRVKDARLKEALFHIQKDFAFAVEQIWNVDDHDPEMMARARRRNLDNTIYNKACEAWREIWKEPIRREAIGFPRPYIVNLNACDQKNLFLDQKPPQQGIAIHPMIALAIRSQFHRLPSTAYDWEKVFEKIKKLSLMLNSSTVRRWDDEGRMVDLLAPDEYPLPEPFYYSLDDWSAIGRMKNLKNLMITCVRVNDFSFLTECKEVKKLSVYNTNFTDCRLLLRMPKLKEVDLRLCRLEHVNALRSASFQYILENE